MKACFEEFRQEVYRRRDEEIRLQKKRRKLMVTLGVPLVLIFSFGFLFYPGAMMAQSKDAAMESAGSLRDESNFFTYRVTVTTGENEWELKEGTEANAVAALLLAGDDTLFNEADGSEEKAETDDTGNSDNTPEKTFQNGEDLSFVLTDQNGENIRFLLEGNNLLRLDTGKERVLTQRQLEHLFSMLEA